MKALTLTQPWATLIACGAKRIETRSWGTDFHGRIAIHAAKGLGPVGGRRGFQEQCAEPPFESVLTKHLEDCGAMKSAYKAAHSIPLGAIVATATLKDVKRIDMKLRAWVLSQTVTPFEINFGDYTSGRYAWFLEDVEPFPEPIYCNGKLSLWDVPPEIMAAMTRGRINLDGFRSDSAQARLAGIE